MRKFAFPRSAALIAGLSGLSLILLAGCEGTGSPVPLYYHYKEYLKQPHYRAYVTTGVGYGSASSWTAAYLSAELAVDAGLKLCRELKSGELDLQIQTAECYLHSIGNINVSGMTGEKLKKAIELYQSNPDATNDDLIPVKK